MVGEFAGLGFTEHVRKVMVLFGYVVHVDHRFGSGRMTGNLGMRDCESETFRALEFACTGVAHGIDEGTLSSFFGFTGGMGFFGSWTGLGLLKGGTVDGSVLAEGELLDFGCNGCRKVMLPNTQSIKGL